MGNVKGTFRFTICKHYGNVTFECSGNVTFECSGNVTFECSGNVTFECSGNVTFECSGNVTFECSGNVTFECSGNVTFECSGNVTFECSLNIPQKKTLSEKTAYAGEVCFEACCWFELVLTHDQLKPAQTSSHASKHTQPVFSDREETFHE